jgi:hypothetical protein
MIEFVQGVCLLDGSPYAEFDSLGNKPVIVCIICLAVIGVFECSSPAALSFASLSFVGRCFVSGVVGGVAFRS